MYAVFRSDLRSCLWTPIALSAQANRTPTRVSTHRGLQSQLTRMGFVIIQQHFPIVHKDASLVRLS